MFNLPDLPYEYNALEPHIDEQTMRIHHDKHHNAYVEKLNAAVEKFKALQMDINELMKDLDAIPDDIKSAVRNHGGGHANHSLFWTVMAPNKGGEPQGSLADAINSSFGNLQAFREEFSKAAMGRFGSGWAWLVVDVGNLKVLDTPNQDTPLSAGKTPILGIDVWEHAYYLKYQNRRAEYIEAWWNVVNWDQVAENFQKVA